MNWKTNWLVGTKINTGWIFAFGFGYAMLWEVIGLVFEEFYESTFMYLGLMILGYLAIVYFLKKRFEIKRRN